MYLWKYWCDTRRGVLTYLGAVIFFAAFWVAGLYRANRIGHIGGDPVLLWKIELNTIFILALFCAVVMSFANGNNSVGADIGNGTGDFLLTRPRSRRYFVWLGWVVGLAEVFVLVALSALLAFGLLTLATGSVWRQVPSPVHLGTMHMSVWLLAATVLLTAGVVYGVTYFLTILLRSGKRGILASLGVVFGYLIARQLLPQWTHMHIDLPDLNFAGGSQLATAWYMTPRIQIIGWTILALAFPIAAQIVLDRSDL
jgi:ABC-type transport system involved in multi-copper enzyme maturation permease subunit